jgi:hypothetical protein
LQRGFDFWLLFPKWVASLDLVENPLANASIVVDIRKDWIAETQSVHDRVRNAIGGKMFDAIINVSGGHATGGVSNSRGQASFL